ncbi:hypothetical protein BT96DRAFT_1058075 [Gymnopus androsaceus JB14]|uniref:Uncharacterized protein n=1 Tax=Gymnopus androsaceus JB14 TaxID=1447944 RepID=A0A6A4IBM1_9AGAR|nr:hypothetical protein BT96DRAFT_1058075 [Gymnopus androsaceus JB14]
MLFRDYFSLPIVAAAFGLLFSTVHAIPVDTKDPVLTNPQAQKNAAALYQSPPASPSPAKAKIPSVEAKPKTPPPAVGSKSPADETKFIITFWTYAEFMEEEEEVPPAHRTPIPNRECNRAEVEQFKTRIREFVPHSIKEGGIVVKGEITKDSYIFSQLTKCNAAWLPVYNSFWLEVRNGGGGKCEDPHKKCAGRVYIGSGHGDLVEKSASGHESDSEDESMSEHSLETGTIFHNIADADGVALSQHVHSLSHPQGH